MDTENIAIVLVAIISFSLVYWFVSSSTGPQANVVNGIQVYSKGPVKETLAGILNVSVVPVQVLLDNASDARPCKVPMQTEAIYGLASSGRNATVQLKIADTGKCLAAGPMNGTVSAACVTPRVLVEDGTANDLVLDPQSNLVTISGTEQWLCANAANVREVIRWALR